MIKIKVIKKGKISIPETIIPKSAVKVVCDGNYYTVYEADDINNKLDKIAEFEKEIWSKKWKDVCLNTIVKLFQFLIGIMKRVIMPFMKRRWNIWQ